MSKAARPTKVPDSATFVATKQVWLDVQPARQRTWSKGGVLVVDGAYRAQRPHGKLTWHLGEARFVDEALAEMLVKEAGLPTGPPLTNSVHASYHHGELRSARFMSGKDELLVDSRWRDGRLHGPFQWRVKLQINFMEPVIALGDVKVDSKVFKLPKPHPVRIECDFIEGKMVNPVYYDAKGMSISPALPIKDWGAKLDKKVLDGYVARGGLARDLAAFFPKLPLVVSQWSPPRPLKSWLGQLPEAHAAAAEAFDTLVRKKRFPHLPRCCDMSSYGFDCVKNALGGAVDARYVGLSSDGSGNMHILDTSTGRVLGYEHEEDSFDKKRAFDNIDAYAFAMIRVEAAVQQRIDRKALASKFKQLGLTAGATELSLAFGE